jgi:hypothetical protein
VQPKAEPALRLGDRRRRGCCFVSGYGRWRWSLWHSEGDDDDDDVPMFRSALQRRTLPIRSINLRPSEIHDVNVRLPKRGLGTVITGFSKCAWCSGRACCMTVCVCDCASSSAINESDRTDRNVNTLVATTGRESPLRHLVTLRCHAVDFCTWRKFQWTKKQQLVTDPAGSSGNSSSLHAAGA